MWEGKFSDRLTHSVQLALHPKAQDPNDGCSPFLLRLLIVSRKVAVGKPEWTVISPGDLAPQSPQPIQSGRSIQSEKRSTTRATAPHITYSVASFFQLLSHCLWLLLQLFSTDFALEQFPLDNQEQRKFRCTFWI